MRVLAEGGPNGRSGLCNSDGSHGDLLPDRLGTLPEFSLLVLGDWLGRLGDVVGKHGADLDARLVNDLSDLDGTGASVRRECCGGAAGVRRGVRYVFGRGLRMPGVGMGDLATRIGFSGRTPGAPDSSLVGIDIQLVGQELACTNDRCSEGFAPALRRSTGTGLVLVVDEEDPLVPHAMSGEDFFKFGTQRFCRLPFAWIRTGSGSRQISIEH